uniref:Protein-lysine N-methyltransferase POPTR_0015s07370g n=1 Tax=Rhizophora mucronata TaxID=61149 RepID=A0A2P2MYB0_RHIMU
MRIYLSFLWQARHWSQVHAYQHAYARMQGKNGRSFSSSTSDSTTSLTKTLMNRIIYIYSQ